MKKTRLSRKNQMDLAKLIRNLQHNERVKLDVSRKIANYLDETCLGFDRKTFMDIANSRLDGDPRTDWCSDIIVENKDEQV